MNSTSPYFWKKVGKNNRDINVRNTVINLNLQLNKKLYLYGFQKQNIIITT